MTTLIKYRVWCTTENAWVESDYVDEEKGAPATCPTDTGHSITAGKTTEIDWIRDQIAHLDAPYTSDGKPILLMAKFRGDVDPYFAGAGDVSGIGDGTEFYTGWDTDPGGSADKIVEWTFKDWVYVAKASLRWVGAGPGDNVTLKVYAPGTPTTVPDPANTGNCNINTGLIIPAAGDGASQVDLSTAVPVPAYDADGNPNGYYDWDMPDTGKGTITEGTPGASAWNLYAVNVDLVQWAKKISLLGSGVEVFDPETKPRRVLPQWKWKIILHTAGGRADFHASWTISTARKKTV